MRDVASKFFEHFVAIADAINTLGGTGLWDDTDGFYYDRLHVDGSVLPLRTRSVVGLIPLLAVEILDDRLIERLPGFRKRMRWFMENRHDLARQITYMEHHGDPAAAPKRPLRKRPRSASGRAAQKDGHYLLAIPSQEHLRQVLRYMLDENEFLSPFGVRSLSAYHREHPVHLDIGDQHHCIAYQPGESQTGMFGGNSNWRGPIWFPINYLLIEALERYHHSYGDSFTIECPTGSGRLMNLKQVADELSSRLWRLFLPDAAGRRPAMAADSPSSAHPHLDEPVLFHEFFHGDTGRGLGASHQTGWTALITRLLAEPA